MAWTYNGIRIFLQTRETSGTQTIARLQPLTGKTIKQIFGHESEVVQLTAYVVGDSDLASLKAMYKTGTAYALLQDATPVDDYFLHSINSTQLKIISQTIRPDLDCESPLYMVEMELYPDDE